MDVFIWLPSGYLSVPWSVPHDNNHPIEPPDCAFGIEATIATESY